MPREVLCHPEVVVRRLCKNDADSYKHQSRRSMSPTLLSFLRGDGPNGAGNTLGEVLARDDDWWEAKHDFVQWLFPNSLPSRANPRAPLLTEEAIEEIQSDLRIQANVDRALLRFTQFLGFELAPDSGYVLLESWPIAKKRWFSRDTHNGLRITRVLKFLVCIGREEQADRLLRVLLQMCRAEAGCGVTPIARSYWRASLDGVTGLEPLPRPVSQTASPLLSNMNEV